MSPRIHEARSRLRAALVAGEPTAAIRRQLEMLEQAESSVAEKAAEAASAAQIEKDAAVAASVAVRSAELAKACEAKVADFIARFPIPQFERGTPV